MDGFPSGHQFCQVSDFCALRNAGRGAGIGRSFLLRPVRAGGRGMRLSPQLHRVKPTDAFASVGFLSFIGYSHYRESWENRFLSLSICSTNSYLANRFAVKPLASPSGRGDRAKRGRRGHPLSVTAHAVTALPKGEPRPPQSPVSRFYKIGI